MVSFPEFSGLGETMVTLIKMLLGDVSYELFDADPFLRARGLALIFIFALLIMTIFMNMLVRSCRRTDLTLPSASPPQASSPQRHPRRGLSGSSGTRAIDRKATSLPESKGST